MKKNVPRVGLEPTRGLLTKRLKIQSGATRVWIRFPPLVYLISRVFQRFMCTSDSLLSLDPETILIQ